LALHIAVAADSVVGLDDWLTIPSQARRIIVMLVVRGRDHDRRLNRGSPITVSQSHRDDES
jgi:hypothetical protein